ncbi:response regulator, partial [bacterium]
MPFEKEEALEGKIHINDFPEHIEKLKDAKFMIVDDSRSVRMVLKIILEEMGLKVVGAAGNVTEAVERAKKLRPNFITLDISMPGGEGTQAIRPILSDLPDAKIIMVSTLGYQDRIVEALELGAVQFVSKPFDREHIKRVLVNTIINN